MLFHHIDLTYAILIEFRSISCMTIKKKMQLMYEASSAITKQTYVTDTPNANISLIAQCDKFQNSKLFFVCLNSDLHQTLHLLFYSY